MNEAKAGVYVDHDVWLAESRRVDERLARIDQGVGDLWAKIDQRDGHYHDIAVAMAKLQGRVTLLISIVLAVTPVLIGAGFTVGFALARG